MNNNCDGKKYCFWEAVQSQLMQQPSRLQSSQWLYPGALIFMLNSLLSHGDHLCLCAARNYIILMLMQHPNGQNQQLRLACYYNLILIRLMLLDRPRMFYR